MEVLSLVTSTTGVAVASTLGGSGVVGAKLYQILIAPILGFENAIDVCIFVMVLGGFLAVMAKILYFKRQQFNAKQSES